MIVLDASVAVKWYLPEAFSDTAIDLLNGEYGPLHGPDLIVVEVAAMLVRLANMDKSRWSDAATLLSDFNTKLVGGMIETHRLSSEDMRQASGLAIELGHPFKDCVYLCLAMNLDCPLVTADARFAAKAKGVWAGMRVLGG